jgi:NMD protein affecting ribosome stability and mRNA decay
MTIPNDDDDIVEGDCHECGRNTDIAWDYLCMDCREVEDKT